MKLINLLLLLIISKLCFSQNDGFYKISYPEWKHTAYIEIASFDYEKYKESTAMITVISEDGLSFRIRARDLGLANRCGVKPFVYSDKVVDLIRKRDAVGGASGKYCEIEKAVLGKLQDGTHIYLPEQGSVSIYVEEHEFIPENFLGGNYAVYVQKNDGPWELVPIEEFIRQTSNDYQIVWLDGIVDGANKAASEEWLEITEEIRSLAPETGFLEEHKFCIVRLGDMYFPVDAETFNHKDFIECSTLCCTMKYGKLEYIYVDNRNMEEYLNNGCSPCVIEGPVPMVIDAFNTNDSETINLSLLTYTLQSNGVFPEYNPNK